MYFKMYFKFGGVDVFYISGTFDFREPWGQFGIIWCILFSTASRLLETVNRREKPRKRGIVHVVDKVDRLSSEHVYYLSGILTLHVSMSGVI